MMLAQGANDMKTTKLRTANALLLSTLFCLVGLLVVAIAASIPAPRAAAAETLDGKAVFAAQKCNLCHSIESQGIASKATSDKTKGPDLSGEGLKRDAAWIGKFLHRVEKIDGKVHKKDLKAASEAEIDALVAWLMTLKKA